MMINKKTVLKEDKMNIVSETTRPNGVKVTLGFHEENGSVTYIVKSCNSYDTRYYGNYSSAANRFNELVAKANAEGGGQIMNQEKIDALQQAIRLVEEACQLVDSAMDDSSGKSHYEAYGKFGFSRLLGNGNPEDSSIYTEIEELEKEIEIADGKKTMEEIREYVEALNEKGDGE